LQTFGNDRFLRLPDVADHVNRGLPLMLLDSRKRTPKVAGPDTLKLLKADLKSLSDDLHKEKLMDQHTMSMLAYVKTIYANLHQRTDHRGDHNSEKHKWLWSAIEAKRDKLTNKTRTSDAHVDDIEFSRGGMIKRLIYPKRWRTQPTITRAKRSLSNRTVEFDSSSDEENAASHDHPDAQRHRLQRFENRIPIAEKDLKECVDIVITAMGEEHEWDADFLEDRCQEALDEIEEAETWEDLEKNWATNWPKLRGTCYHFWRDAQILDDNQKWVKTIDHGRATSRGRKELQIVKPEQEDYAEGEEMPKLGDAKAILKENIQRQMEFSRQRNKSAKTVKSFMRNEEIWLAVYDILKNEAVMTGNIFHINHCRKRLMRLTQLDNLPEENTLSGLVLLRSAWTLVDIFAAKSLWYKLVAKIAYFVFLMVSTCIMIITCIAALYPDHITEDVLQKILLGFALVGSFAAAWTTFLDPAQKWLQLRGGSLALQSEIWKFRARVGEYSASGHTGGSFAKQESEMCAQNKFQENMMLIRDRVAQQAGLKETKFYATPTTTDDIYTDVDTKARSARKASFLGICAEFLLVKLGCQIPRGPRLTPAHFKHGQYADGPLGEEPMKGDDSFHSPVTPNAFIRWRLNPQMAFYQHRIPRYARKRQVFQAFLLLSSICCTWLASMKWTRSAAIVAALAGALTAWQEFTSLAKKLSRYSAVSETLSKLLLWWQSLAEVDQSNVRNVERLVLGTEDLISSEHSAWLSDAQKAAKMFAAMEQANKGVSNAEQGKQTGEPKKAL